MKNKKLSCLLMAVLAILFANSVSGIGKKNYITQKTDKAPVIDGIGDEECWTYVPWAYINQPYDGSILPDSTDFYGRYKVTWTDTRLYILMEITDDFLIDNRTNPKTNYWEDDCTEFFIDEDNTPQGHECGEDAYNAFAYHIAAVPRDKNNYSSGSKMSFDSPDGINHVIDLGTDCNTNNAMNFDEHVNVKIKKNGNNYTWELEFKIFDKDYEEDGLSNTPVTLTVNKEIGFAIAYCDDDEGQRDNMIGDIPDHNDYGGPYPFYRFSNEFGILTLVDTRTSVENMNLNSGGEIFFLWPNPVENSLNIMMNFENEINATINIYNISGQILLKDKIGQKKQKIDISQLMTGTYIVELCYAGVNYKQKLIKY